MCDVINWKAIIEVGKMIKLALMHAYAMRISQMEEAFDCFFLVNSVTPDCAQQNSCEKWWAAGKYAEEQNGQQIP